MRDKDDFILIWCNEEAASDTTLTTLQPLCNDIHYYQDPISCIAYIESLHPKQQVFLVVSPSFTFLEEIHGKRQIDTIFIFELEVTSQSNVIDIAKYPKAVSVAGDLKVLAKLIIKTSMELVKSYQLFNLYNHKQKALCNLSENSSSFLWFQLFKDMLINLPNDPKQDEKDRIQAKNYMIQQCYLYYRHNLTQMKNIADFEVNYQSSNAIRWYTSDSFMYKLINKALRTEDIEVLYTFRYFIIDLCADLATKYKDMVDFEISLSSVYRGTQMTIEEINYLKENIGCLIATNGFLSTSRSRDVAEIFAGSGKIILRNFIFMDVENFSIIIDVIASCFISVSWLYCI
ncbi:unnamed protein product, partial [Rotaria sp. Silwood1]